MSCKLLLKLKGWTEIDALENTESIKNEGLYLHAGRIGTLSSPAPFWYFGDSPCAAADEAELRLISDCWQHLSCAAACMYVWRHFYSRLKEAVMFSLRSLQLEWRALSKHNYTHQVTSILHFQYLYTTRDKSCLLISLYTACVYNDNKSIQFNSIAKVGYIYSY